MGAELPFAIGVISLGILSTVMLSIAVFTFSSRRRPPMWLPAAVVKLARST